MPEERHAKVRLLVGKIRELQVKLAFLQHQNAQLQLDRIYMKDRIKFSEDELLYQRGYLADQVTKLGLQSELGMDDLQGASQPESSSSRPGFSEGVYSEAFSPNRSSMGAKPNILTKAGDFFSKSAALPARGSDNRAFANPSLGHPNFGHPSVGSDAIPEGGSYTDRYKDPVFKFEFQKMIQKLAADLQKVNRSRRAELHKMNYDMMNLVQRLDDLRIENDTLRNCLMSLMTADIGKEQLSEIRRKFPEINTTEKAEQMILAILLQSPHILQSHSEFVAQQCYDESRRPHHPATGPVGSSSSAIGPPSSWGAMFTGGFVPILSQTSLAGSAASNAQPKHQVHSPESDRARYILSRKSLKQENGTPAQEHMTDKNVDDSMSTKTPAAIASTGESLSTSESNRVQAGAPNTSSSSQIGREHGGSNSGNEELKTPNLDQTSNFQVPNLETPNMNASIGGSMGSTPALDDDPGTDSKEGDVVPKDPRKLQEEITTLKRKNKNLTGRLHSLQFEVSTLKKSAEAAKKNADAATNSQVSSSQASVPGSKRNFQNDDYDPDDFAYLQKHLARVLGERQVLYTRVSKLESQLADANQRLQISESRQYQPPPR